MRVDSGETADFIYSAETEESTGYWYHIVEKLRKVWILCVYSVKTAGCVYSAETAAYTGYW